MGQRLKLVLCLLKNVDSIRSGFNVHRDFSCHGVRIPVGDHPCQPGGFKSMMSTVPFCRHAFAAYRAPQFAWARIAPATAGQSNTLSTAHRLIASLGMPKTTQVAHLGDRHRPRLLHFQHAASSVIAHSPSRSRPRHLSCIASCGTKQHVYDGR